jgi:hypothetical protein
MGLLHIAQKGALGLFFLIFVFNHNNSVFYNHNSKQLRSRSSSEGFTLQLNADGQNRLEVVRVLAADPDLAPLMGIKALQTR